MAQVPNVDVEFDGDGVTAIFDFDFPYQKQSEIFVSVDGVNVTYTWLAGNTHSVQVLPAPALGTRVRIYRSTLAFVPLHVFAAGVPFLPRYVDENNRQMLYVVQEGIDTSNAAATDAQEAIATANAATLVADQALTNSQTAINTADQAVVTANAAVVTANEADANADQAVITANEAKLQAAAADGKADDAVEKADAAVVTANDAKATAEAIADTADAAFVAAGNAVITADNALVIAQGIDAKATQALSNSVTAREESAEALETANAIDGKAQTALDNSAEALSTANEAKATADAVDGKAQTALDNAASAVADADEALTIVTGVSTDLTALANRVTATESRLTVEEAATAEHNTRLLGLRTDVNALRTDVTALQDANKPRVPTAMSINGQNGVLALVDGSVWVSVGNTAVYGNWLAGRGASGLTGRYGLDNFVRVVIPSTSKVVQANFVGMSAYALLESGDLYVWGRNFRGELGLGHQNVVTNPVLSTTGVREVYSSHTNNEYNNEEAKLFIRKDDALYVAGSNANGQFGIGTTTNSSVWIKSWDFTTRGTIRALYSLGGLYGSTFLITTDNHIYSVGDNRTGATGVGGNGQAQITTWTDTTINWGGQTAVSEITYITGGYGYYSNQAYAEAWTAVFAKDKWLRVCGTNGYGQAGQGTVGGNQFIPALVPLPSLPADFVALAGTPAQLYVLGQNGTVYSWGYADSNGQLGRGVVTSSGTPTAVPITGKVTRLLLRGNSFNTWSFMSTMFVEVETGVVMSWGTNGYGNCGCGDTAISTTPRRVLFPVTDVDGSVFKVRHMFIQGASQAAWAGPLTPGVVTEAGYIYGWGHNGQFQLSGQGAANASEVIPCAFTPAWRARH